MTLVGCSYRNEQGYVVFDNEEIQAVWKNNLFSPNQDEGPQSHLHMIVDIIELSDHRIELRLLTIYDSKEKRYDNDEERIAMFAMSSGMFYGVDTNGNKIKEKEDEWDDEEFDYPPMKRDCDGFYSGQCQCGGIIMPMYDEHPFWIAFCTGCDKGWESSEGNPLPY